MTREHDPCAFCEKFIVPADGAPEGYCTTWQQPKPWNGQIGVLFIEAKNRAARQRYVTQQQAQQQETAPA